MRAELKGWRVEKYLDIPVCQSSKALERPSAIIPTVFSNGDAEPQITDAIGLVLFMKSVAK